MGATKATSQPAGADAGPESQQETRTSHSGDDSDHLAIETESIRPAPRAGRRLSGGSNSLYRPTSHVSGPDGLEPDTEQHGGSSALRAADPYGEAGDEIYDRVAGTRSRKAVIVAVLSFCAFLSPVSSTSVLSATPEVAAAYGTTGSVINASNAGYMVFMGLSPIVCGPMSQVFGRKPVSLSPFHYTYLFSTLLLVDCNSLLVRARRGHS